MVNALSIFAVILMLLGTAFLALDILKPSHLKKVRSFLFEFAKDVKKARLIPTDKRVAAHRKTIFQMITSDKSEKIEFKDAYKQNLIDMNYEPDFNLNIYYRTFVYSIAATLVLITCIFIGFKIGYKALLSYDGLKLLGFFLFVNIGLAGSWFFDVVSEEMRKDDKDGMGFPPLYKSMFGRGRGDAILQLIYNSVHISINLIAKSFGYIIQCSFNIEKYTKRNQGPRIFGILLVTFGTIIQLLVLLIGSSSP